MYRQGLMARGDYYQGDGIFSFLGSALKTVAPILPFGIGTAARAVGGLLSPAQKAVAVQNRVVTAQSPIGATLPPSPNFYGLQAGGVKVGVTTPGNGNRTQSNVGHIGGKKRRRMNVTNPRALRRAIRRARGFEKMARKVLGFTSPRKPKGRVYFRNKRRAA